MAKLKSLLKQLFERGKRFNEVDYVADLARIRYTIAEMMHKYGLIENIIIDNELRSINPNQGRIAKTGAIGVDFFNGTPHALLTPYGEIMIDADFHRQGNLNMFKKFYQELKITFGLIEIESTKYGDGCETGPKCMITKLPWREKELLSTKYREITSTLNHDQVKEEIVHFDGLQGKANAKLVKNKQAHYVIEVPERLPEPMAQDQIILFDKPNVEM